MTTPNEPGSPTSRGGGGTEPRYGDVHGTAAGGLGSTGATEPPLYGTTTTGHQSAESDSGQSGTKQQAKQAAGTAADEGKHVAGVAKEEAKSVASDAKEQAVNLVDQAKSQVDHQSRQQRDKVAGTLQQFADQLEQMARGEGAPSGMAQDVVRQVADRARSIGSSMHNREPADLLDDVRDFARRKPGTFLLGALAAGMLAGRVTRGAKQASAGDQGGGHADTSRGVYDDPRRTGAGYGTTTTYDESAYPTAGVSTEGVSTGGVSTEAGYTGGSRYPEAGTHTGYPAGSAEPGTSHGGVTGSGLGDDPTRRGTV